jgi:trimeric autotransporter adhesin
VTVETDIDALVSSTTVSKNRVVSSKAALTASVADALAARNTALDTANAIAVMRDEIEDHDTNTSSQLSATSAPVDDLAGRTVSPEHTAVDVFIYDTAKDSDGGAWRKRTQKMSWYNESGAATGKWLGVHASEADARNAYPNLGSELVTNGDFASDSDWSISPSGSAEISNGVLFVDGVTSTVTQNNLGTEDNEMYVVEFDYTFQGTATSGTRAYIRLGEVSGQKSLNGAYPNQTKRASFIMQAGSGNYLALVPMASSGESITIDNISVKEITSQTTTTGDYFQLSTDKRFYKLDAGSGTTQVYRGSRNEFPATAVVVVEVNKVIIYDADDPTLPMWMVFTSGSGVAVFFAGDALTSASFLNGVLVFGSSNPTGLKIINFVSEVILGHRYSTNNTYTGEFLGSISERNTATFSGIVLPQTIRNVSINDVAMTVLPDAPIDSATKLPIPTIAVATADGVSIIKDDGTVVDIVDFYTKTQSVEFYQGGVLFNARNSTITSGRYIFYPSIPSSDLNHPISGLIQFSNATVPAVNTVGSRKEGDAISLGNNFVIGDSSNTVSSGLSFVAYNPTSLADSMVAYTTSTYASGWMNGDIKLATLADTDSTSLVDIELIENGGFDTDISGWTDASSAGGSIAWNASGYLDITNTSGTGRAQQSVTLVVGSRYKFSIENVGTNNLQYFLGTSAGGTQVKNVTTVNGGATGSFEFTATSTYLGISIDERTAGDTCSVDNISVRPAVSDRSINTNGLIVNGTITREPVAPGAELVAYSGFSSTNYLSQPYNSDLDFGTGDFCVMGWAKQSGTATRYILDTRNNSGGGIVIQAGTAFVVALDSGSNVTGGVASDGVWQFFVALRESGVLKLYVNGRSAGTVTNTNAASNSSSTLTVGARGGLLSNSFQGSLALLRISATAPTAEQIEYIYDSERVLFNDNAKCTIYGTSDNVTALAHDKDTDLLHVGTSAGRSVFKGLRRVSHADGGADVISAAGGVIVEAD